MCLTFSKFFLSSVHEFILTHPYISFKVHSYVLAIMIFLVYILLVAGVQPRWIQGIQSGDGAGEDQETTA